MNDIDIVLLGVGGLVLLLGLFSGFIHTRLPLSTPFLALVAGLLVGPAGFDLLDPHAWGPLDLILEQAARLTLAIGLMATALRLPPRYFVRQWRLQAVLLGLLMPVMWGVTALLVHLWLGVPLLMALLIGAIVTPTDPIVASSIVTSPLAQARLPERLRNALSGESGANDGLAHGLVALPILLLTMAPPAAAGTWIATVLLREIGGGIVLGLLAGAAAGWLLTWSERRQLLEDASFLAYTVALGLLVLGAASLAGTNGVIAVFVAGLAFDNMVGGKERAEEARFQEAVNQLFTLPVFALVGLSVPLESWLALGWRGAALVVAVLMLRRVPGVLALGGWMFPLRRDDAWFVGWFGPIGVSAVLYAMEAVRQTGEADIWAVTSVIVCASIAAHGMTSVPLTRLYGQRSAGGRR